MRKPTLFSNHSTSAHTLKRLFRISALALFGLLSAVAQSATPPDQPTIRFIVVTHGQANDPFWLRVKNGVEQAAKELKVEAIYRAPETFDMVAMSNMIESAIQQEPDGLVVSIPDEAALGPVITKAIQAGIPVVSINSGAEAAKRLNTLLHVGSDEFKAGILAGQRLKQRNVKHPICVNHEVGNVALDRRCEGVSEGFGQTIKVVPSTVNSVEAVYAAIKAALQADEKIDAIVALGATSVAEPALKAIHETGRSHIVLATFDLSPTVLEAISEDKVAFAIDQQQFLQGYLPIVHLSLYHRYNLLPPKALPSGPGLVLKQDADTMIQLSGVGIR